MPGRTLGLAALLGVTMTTLPLPNVGARPSTLISRRTVTRLPGPGAIPARALLVGRSNQSDNMTEDDNQVDDEVVASGTRKNTLVKVVRRLDEGCFEVVRHQDNRELARFSFSIDAGGSLDRDAAMAVAEEYMNGYLHGVSDYKGES